MNLTISKEQIINGLQAVQNVVSTRTTLPILSNVLLRAENDRLEFTATDLDVTIACAVEAKIKDQGIHVAQEVHGGHGRGACIFRRLEAQEHEVTDVAGQDLHFLEAEIPGLRVLQLAITSAGHIR